jgi:predicted amidohydrolase YtcJ
MRPLLLGLAFVTALSAQSPDLILYNGKFVTLWDGHPQAQAVAIRAGRFLAVGSNEEVRRLAAASTRQTDLRGRTVLPGLIDSHTHPIGSALSEQEEEIPVLHSLVDLENHIARVAKASPPSKLIFVPKVYATRMKEGRYPTRQELDRAGGAERLIVADNGYAAVLNTGALKKAGITRDTPQPANGKIIKDASGEPTGLLLGAPQLVASFRSDRQPTDADRLWAIREMHKRYNEAGLTSTIDRAENPAGMRAYQELWRKGELTVRTSVTMLVNGSQPWDRLRAEILSLPNVTGFGDDWLRTGSLKIVLDGGILIGTAYMREPYGEHTEVYGFHDPEYRGVLAVPKENIFEMARLANQLGWQMTAHTTGGASTDLLLDAYEAADKERSIRERRFTLTHANFPNRSVIERSQRMGVVLDMQPAWLHLDGAALSKVLGPQRMLDFQPYKALFDAGLVVAGGSDHMIKFDSRDAINPFNPFFGMWMAVTRRLTDGSVLLPEQRLTREQALRMWTLHAAYASFEETRKGSIEPGKLADLVVISADFLTCPEDEIRNLAAEGTMVGGRFVYTRPSFDPR